MSPGTGLYQALDAYTGSTPEYFAVDANFVTPPILSHLLDVAEDGVDVGDVLIDRVFDRRPNDVAVPTIGVGDPGDADVDPPPAAGVPPAQPVPGFPAPTQRHLAFGAGLVWHCSYFTQQQTATAIKKWLAEPL